MSDLEWLRLEIADRIARIGDELAEWSIPMNHLTFVARDPTRPEMYLVITNEKDIDLGDVADLIVSQSEKVES